jgi:hypothetical protein
MIVGWLALLYAATGGVIAMLSPYTAEVFRRASVAPEADCRRGAVSWEV